MHKRRKPLMSRIGYARVSTIDQDTALQVSALTACRVRRHSPGEGKWHHHERPLRIGNHLGLPAQGRYPCGDPDRSVGTLHRRPANHRADDQGQGRHRNAPNSRSTPPPRPARRSWTCWGCSPSSKPTSARNASLKASRRPRSRCVQGAQGNLGPCADPPTCDRRHGANSNCQDPRH